LQKVFLQHEYAVPFSIVPRTIVDAGANIGAAALYFAKAYPGAHIIAIEPENSNFALLQRNCAGVSNITLVRAALWHETAELQLVDPQAEKDSFSYLPTRVGENADIRAVCVNDILEEFNFNHIDILKIDIEGAEREIFRFGNRDWLDKVGVIAIELHDRFKSGCAESFYSALHGRRFSQEIRGEMVFIDLQGDDR